MSLARMLFVVLIAWAACLPACAHLLVRDDGTVMNQGNAIYVVWREVYGRKDAYPHVRWITGDALTCTDPNSNKPGFEIVGPEGAVCREGMTVVPWQIEVSYHGERFSETALAHELWHAALMREGVLDPFHRTEGFQPGGIVDQANSKLITEGL